MNEIIFRLNPFVVCRTEVEVREGSGGKPASEVCSNVKICCPGVLLVGQGWITDSYMTHLEEIPVPAKF